MEIFLKQFTVWATKLKNDSFFRARVILGILYFVTIALLVFVFHWLLHLINTQAEQNAIIPPETLVEHLSGESVSISVLFVILLGSLGYLALSKTFKPFQEMSRMQKRFVDDASHELQTPLAVIKTGSEIALRDNSATAGQLRKALESNMEEADRMSNIIRNLLMLASTASTGEYRASFSEVLLPDVIDTSVNIVQTALADIPHPPIIIVKNDTAVISGMRTALEQVLINILNNAVAHTPKTGRVDIQSTSDNRHFVTIEIRDTGTGIKEKDLPHIFEPFYKSAALRPGHTAIGLGLTLVKKIMDEHGGTIRIKSAPKKGTAVIMTFPLAKK